MSSMYENIVVYVCTMYHLLLIHLTPAETSDLNMSYTVKATDQYQPSFLLTLEDGLDQGFNKVYVVGYRGCSSNSTDVCYIRGAYGVSCYSCMMT